ncbi:hypothetical protein COOONC_17549 [Cooperia oncophora]
MCCNRKLEKVMRDVLEELTADKDWQTCNVQKIANTLQPLASLGDFASKSHFYHDLICKIEYQGRYFAVLLPNSKSKHHPTPLMRPTPTWLQSQQLLHSS